MPRAPTGNYIVRLVKAGKTHGKLGPVQELRRCPC